MLKYIALVSLCTGAGFAADFVTGQAARAVVGQTTFTTQATLTATTTTVANTNYVNFTGASKTVFGAMGGLAYANNQLFVTEATSIGFQPSLDRVLIFGNINAPNTGPASNSIPPAAQSIPPYSGRCPVCVTTATVALTTLDGNGQVTHYNETDVTQTPPAPIYPPVTAASFRQPTAVATDGRILAVTDTLNNRVLLWHSIDGKPLTDFQGADAVLGQANFTTVAPLAVTASAMRSPQGVWIQGNRLFVADTGNNRILIWNSIPPAGAMNTPADLVLGQPNLTTVTPVNPTNLQLVAANNIMLSPTSVTSDGQRLIVSDLGYSRVLIWNSIPTTNMAPADVQIGQRDFTTSVPNDSVDLCKSTLVNSVVTTAPVKNATTSTVTWVSGSKFPSSLQGAVVVLNSVDYQVVSWTSTTSLTLATNAGTNTNIAMTSYPARCAKTLNFPRYALSDGKRLFIADTGNDRVLVFNTIPSTEQSSPATAPAADVILGQIDEFSDPIVDGSTIGNIAIRSAADVTQSPTSLAWDPVNQNLYVSDPNDFRVTVFSPGQSQLPLSGVVNAASRAVFATGTVSVGGAIKVQDTATVTIGNSVDGSSTDYVYTVQTNDTLDLVAKGLAAKINKGPLGDGAGDPNVFVTEQTGTSTIQFFARKPGPLGNNVTLATSVGPSTNAQISLSSSGSSLAGGASAGIVAPGTLVLINGTNLANGTASAPLTSQLPFDLAGTQVYIDGMRAPLFEVSPTQIGAQIPWATFGAASVSIWVRTTTGGGAVSSTAIGLPLQTQNPGVFACDATVYYSSKNGITDPNDAQCLSGGTEPRAAIALHASNFSSTTVSVDGSIQGGDIGTITIATRPYSYTVQAGDTLASVRDGLIQAINDDPGSPLSAQATGEFTRIRLTAKVQGAQGTGVTVAASVSTVSSITAGAQLTLTATHPITCCFSINNLAGQPVTLNNPAIPGETIAIFVAGLGLVAPETARVALNDGTPYTGPPNTPRSDVSVTAGGGGATVISSGLSSNPGSEVGVYTILLELSAALNPNPFAQLTVSQGANTSNIVTIPIASPSAVRVTLTPDNTTIASGTAMNITLSALDQYGNPASNYSGSLAISTTDTAATLPTSTVSAGGGAGVFAVTFNTKGTQTVTVVDTLTGITGTSGPITVQ